MSDWSKVTRPIPVPNEWTKPFWEAARQGVLALQRCQSCRRFQHPPYVTCVNCMAIDLKFEPVAGKGSIHAYTIMYHTGDKRFASAVPYASIVVELDEAPGALMAGNLLGAPYTEAKVGRRVEVMKVEVGRKPGPAILHVGLREGAGSRASLGPSTGDRTESRRLVIPRRVVNQPSRILDIR
jgi:hypothetical protein